MGPKSCPETSVRNFDSAPCTLPDERRFHVMIWWCWPWFGSTWSGSKQSGLV